LLLNAEQLCHESGGHAGPHSFTMGVSQPSKRVHKKADRKGNSSRQKGTKGTSSTRSVDAASSSRGPAPPQVVSSAVSLPCTCSECLQGSLHAYHPCFLCAVQTHYAAHYVTGLQPLFSSMASAKFVKLHSIACAGEATFDSEWQEVAVHRPVFTGRLHSLCFSMLTPSVS